MCNFCYLKVPAHSPLAKNTQIGALYNLFHFMHDKITQTEIIFWNNEPLILQNRTCLLEYDFIYCGTSIIFLWGRGCHMNAGRLVWLVCTNPPPPSRSWGWAAHQQSCMAYMLTQAHCSVDTTLPLCNCPASYIYISLALCRTWEFLAFCDATQSEQFLTELSEVLECP